MDWDDGLVYFPLQAVELEVRDVYGRRLFEIERLSAFLATYSDKMEFASWVVNALNAQHVHESQEPGEGD